MRSVDLSSLLSDADPRQHIETFAILVLGVAESVASGVLTTSGAVATFFNADNCLFVKKSLKNRIADQIMGRGVQLPDLFDALSPDEAARELRQELHAIQDLCRSLLHRTPLAA